MSQILRLFVLLSLIGLGWFAWFWLQPEPIKVGVLHSQTGTMAQSETPVVLATLAAIDDINAQGGLLGRPIQVVMADGASTDHIFASEAKRLMIDEKVAVIFGGWTSASRKAMLPMLENERGLLFYPVQYEGLEQSPQIVYLGAPPNQQLYPAVSWMVSHLGKRLLIVGSDYIFPRMATNVAERLISSLNGTLCKPVFLPLGQQDMSVMMQAIDDCKPDAVLNLINGDSNVAFFKALDATAHSVPVMSLSMTEADIQYVQSSAGKRVLKNHYAVANYFQSLDTPENARMKQKLSSVIATQGVLSSPMSSAWDAVHLWAAAVKTSNSADTAMVNRNLAGMSIESSSGVVSVDVDNRHVWQRVFVGKVNDDGQFDILWQSQLPVKPEPWPPFYTKAEWLMQVQYWFARWGGRWQAE